MLKIPITTASAHYEAIIESGALARAGQILRQIFPSTTNVFVVTVAPVRRNWGKTLASSLHKAGFASKFLDMRDGERFKRLAAIESLADEMLRLGADRKAVVIAFGGGVVGDVAGMLASVYM